jgi:hypothetical protein
MREKNGRAATSEGMPVPLSLTATITYCSRRDLAVLPGMGVIKKGISGRDYHPDGCEVSREALPCSKRLTSDRRQQKAIDSHISDFRYPRTSSLAKRSRSIQKCHEQKTPFSHGGPRSEPIPFSVPCR